MQRLAFKELGPNQSNCGVDDASASSTLGKKLLTWTKDGACFCCCCCCCCCCCFFCFFSLTTYLYTYYLICLSVYLSVCLYLPVHPSIYLSHCLSLYICLNLSINVCLSVPLHIHLPIYLQPLPVSVSFFQRLI